MGDAPNTQGGRVSGPGSNRRRIVFFTITGALAFGILWVFRAVLAPFLIALVVAYVFAPVVERLERVTLFGRKTPRWAAVLFLYTSLLSTMAGAIAVGAPLLGSEVQRLSREIPVAIETVRTEWLPRLDGALRSATSTWNDVDPRAPDESVAEASMEGAGVGTSSSSGIRVVPREDGGYEIVLPETGIELHHDSDGHYVIAPRREAEQAPRRAISVQITEALRSQLRDSEQSVASALRTAQSLIAAVVGGVFRFFIMLMLSAYLLISAESIRRFFRQLVRADRRSAFDTLLRRIDRGLSGVVRGQLLICLVNGVLSGIGFYFAGLDYWPILTLIATVLSIIPIFGAILSSIPAVVIGLQDGFGVALFVLAWIIGIHQVEANLLNPKIMGDAAKVHPVLVVFALLAGEHFFGIVGALLAVPVLSIGQSLFVHFREVALGVPASESSPGLSASAPTLSASDTVVGSIEPIPPGHG